MIPMDEKQLAVPPDGDPTSDNDIRQDACSAENNTSTTQHKGNFMGKVHAIVIRLNYVPARCRYDPERPFAFNLALNILFGFAAAFTVANLYYNHPILNVLAEDFGVSYERVSIIPNVMQAGYASGLLFITPLGDLFRRRSLTLGLIIFTVMMWLGCTVTRDFSTFAGLSFVVGLTTVTPQLMIPLVGDLAPEGKKATAIAIVSSGLQLGLLLARVLSGIITQYSSWRTVYWMGFGVQLLIFGLLWLFMPDYPPKNRNLAYHQILISMFKLIITQPVLLQASLNGLFLSGTFMLYWTTVTFLLASPPYEFDSGIIGLFGLIGVAAIAITPWIGKYVIDRWLPLLSTILGSIVVLIGQLIGTYAGKANVSAPILQAWFIDTGIMTAQVANRAAIYQLDAKSRNRINSVYMLSVFIGQVMGTGIGAKSYAAGGWLASGCGSVAVTLLGLGVALSRGPHTKAWFGWEGGASFKLLRQSTTQDPDQAEEAAEEGRIREDQSKNNTNIPDADAKSAAEHDGGAMGRNTTRDVEVGRSN